jgi:CheY-like chemotaxis protein
MSVAQPRSPAKPGVISELALARAQRNTVVIVDDLFSSRLLLAEIVRQIDGKLNLELFDTPSRALEYARNNRVDMVLTDYKLPEFDGVQLVRHCGAPRASTSRSWSSPGGHAACAIRRSSRRHRLPDEAARRARNPGALREPARTAAAQSCSPTGRVLQYQVDESIAEIHERELETLSSLPRPASSATGPRGITRRMARYRR